MAERRRNRKRTEYYNPEDLDKPKKVEYEVAKYLRSHLPQKQTTLSGHKVDYFIANRAIDLLMNSKWAKADKRTDETMFPSRESATNFMNTMLEHKFFHRAKAIIVKKEIKNNKKPDGQDSTDEGNKSESKKSKKEKHEEQQQKKEKKKVKLAMHMTQVFVDSNEPYVWIYDYIPMKTWLIGGCLVIAAIAICLFPLWPRTVRNYVYYLSIAVAVFLFFIIALALLKLVIFAIVWTLTFGKHHLWILPNLTEDVGFFESFWPLYKHECRRSKTSDESSSGETQEKLDDEKIVKNDEITKEGVETDNEDGENGADGEEEEDDENATTTKATNGFELLDSNECNDG